MKIRSSLEHWMQTMSQSIHVAKWCTQVYTFVRYPSTVPCLFPAIIYSWNLPAVYLLHYGSLFKVQNPCVWGEWILSGKIQKTRQYKYNCGRWAMCSKYWANEMFIFMIRSSNSHDLVFLLDSAAHITIAESTMFLWQLCGILYVAFCLRFCAYCMTRIHFCTTCNWATFCKLPWLNSTMTGR